MSPGLGNSFKILKDGTLVSYQRANLDNLLESIEKRLDPVGVMGCFSKLGFNFDFEDVLEEGSVLINITYKGQGVAEFEVTGDFWGILKFTYDWYINNRTEETTTRISGYCQSIQDFGRQDERNER